jgi:hypothetical protein
MLLIMSPLKVYVTACVHVKCVAYDSGGNVEGEAAAFALVSFALYRRFI